MNVEQNSLFAQEGDLVQLSASQIKYFMFPIKSGQVLQTHRGVITHDDLIGKPWGSKITSHQGNPFLLLKPGITEIIATTKRNTQILYPKDIGYILLRLNVIPGSKVLEAGTGSGGLTQVLATFVGEHGRVFSMDIRDEMQKLAKKNLERLGVVDRVCFINANLADGLAEKNFDSIFLDLPNPYDYLNQIRESLIPGGFLGALLPTVNQVGRFIAELKRKSFGFIDVCEILMRFYQADPEKLRPVDRMVAHTGFLIFARSIIPE